MPRTNLSKLADKKTEEVKEVVKEEKVEETKKKPIEKPKKKEFSQSDGILCKSVVHGLLYFEGAKTGMIYTWSDYADETEVEYRDLVAAVRTKDKAVYEPRFVVLDEDFIKEYPALEKFYSNQFTTRDIKAILDLPEAEMVEKIKELPKGAVESLKSIAAKQVSTGRLDSIRKIRALDELFGTDLNLLSDLLRDE